MPGGKCGERASRHSSPASDQRHDRRARCADSATCPQFGHSRARSWLLTCGRACRSARRTGASGPSPRSGMRARRARTGNRRCAPNNARNPDQLHALRRRDCLPRISQAKQCCSPRTPRYWLRFGARPSSRMSQRASERSHFARSRTHQDLRALKREPQRGPGPDRPADVISAVNRSGVASDHGYRFGM